MSAKTLIEQLRALAHCEHSDLSIAAEAADEIERLTSERDSLREFAKKIALRLGIEVLP